MVPEAEFTSYYGRPVIKAPVWAARDIAGYLFLGGLAGASSVLAAGAELTGRPALARARRPARPGAIARVGRRRWCTTSAGRRGSSTCCGWSSRPRR